MNIAIIGLGIIGKAIGKRAVIDNHTVTGFDIDEEAQESAQDHGITCYPTAEAAIKGAHCIWLSLPAGDAVDTIIQTLIPHCSEQTVIVDGGNSFFQDSICRHQLLAEKKIPFLDCGTSGGTHGKKNGFCCMFGGNQQYLQMIEPLIKSIAQPDGYAHVGPAGAGHYVKMIHNGIEYAMMQAYGEGFRLLKEGSFAKANLPLATIAHLWNHGSIIRSFLLELTAPILADTKTLQETSGAVNETGMGAWTVEEAQKNMIKVPTILSSVEARARSRVTGGNFGTKIVAQLRKSFGGHAVELLTTPDRPDE